MSDLLSKYGYTPYQAEADEELAKTAATMPPSPLNKYGITTQAQATQQQQAEMNPLARTGLGAMRGLASALEPLALPQDILFAVAGGGLDDETTIGDRLKRVEWGKYVPFGEAPARPADGAEILGLMGVKDERIRKWGGVVMDLTADPLIAGSLIRAGGKLSKLEDLVKLGDKVDEWTSLGGQARMIRNAPAIKPWADARTEQLLKIARNPDKTLFGFSAGEYAKGFLTSRVARNLRYGEKSGEAISDAKALADQKAGNVRAVGYDILAEAENNLLGRDTRSWLKKGIGILSGTRKAEEDLRALPQILRDTIMTSSYDLARKQGVLLSEGLGSSKLPEIQALSPLASLIGDGRRAQAAVDTEATIRKVREVAEQSKFNPDLAEKRFRNFTQTVTEVDAMFGYHVSGLEWVRDRVQMRVMEKGGTREDAVRVWDDALASGVQGRFDEFKEQLVTFGRNADPENPQTFRSLIDGDDKFNALDLGAYLKGLQEGHMRRSFAMMQDDKSAGAWVKSLQTGKVLMSNLLGDDMIDTALSSLPVRGGTATGNVADLIKGYRSALEAEGRGTLLTQRGMLTHLTENGVSKSEAQDAYAALLKQMNPDLEGPINQLREYAAKYQARAEEGRLSGAGPAFYGQRNDDIDLPFLEMLGEYANPILSLAESADAAKVRISRQDFMQQVFDIGTKNGLVKDAAHTDRNGAVFTPITGGAWGAFEGRYMHPYLQKELLRTMKPPAINQVPLAKAFDRVRGLITGGYLANPGTLTANIGGIVYSNAMADVNPARMMKAMAETFVPLIKGEAPELKRLSELGGGLGGDLASASMQQNVANLRLSSAGLEGGTLQQMFEKVTDLYAQQLQAPLGQKWAGLEGFQFIETWGRVAAFKAEKEYWLKNQDRLQRLQPKVNLSSMTEEQRVAAVEKFAAQKARIGALDYSELPESLTMLRNTGMLPFAAFPYLIAARNVNALINRPGKLAVADRLSEAVWSASFNDDEERLAVWAGMPDWLKEEKGVPVRMMMDKAGDKRVSLIPFASLIPTSTNFAKPYAESLTSLGLYGPLFDLTAAFVRGDGEAVLSGRYGARVYDADARGADKYAQAGQFLLNSLAPTFAKRGVALAGSIGRAAMPMDPELAETIYTFQERETGKAKRRLADELLSTFLRSPQVVTMTGPLANVKKEANRLRIKRDTELRSLKKKYQEAVAMGKTAKAERLRNEIIERSEEFAELNASLAAMYQGAKR